MLWARLAVARCLQIRVRSDSTTALSLTNKFASSDKYLNALGAEIARVFVLWDARGVGCSWCGVFV